MKKELLVRIFTPTTAGEDGEKGECATGFPVAPDLVLTCRHAVRPEDRDARRPIEIQWFHHVDEDGKKTWCKLAETDDVAIVWESEALDAALLRCPRPDGLTGQGYISSALPTTRTAWESAGFPRVAKYENVQHAASFSGTMHSMAEADWQFELDVDVAPKDGRDWSGASGMPICLVGSNSIIGVFREIPPNLEGKRAFATPSWKLLACPRFRDLVRPEDHKKERAELVATLTEMLRQSPAAARTIQDKSGLCAVGVVDDVAACLANAADANALAQGLLSAHDAAPTREARADIAAMAQHLMPFLCDPGFAAEFRKQRDGSGPLNIEVPCWLEMVAEIYMAAIEGRRTNYRPRCGPAHYPCGERNRPAPPIRGIEEDRSKLESFQKDIVDKSATEWQRVSTSIDDYGLASLAADRPAGLRREDAIRDANEELKLHSRNGRFYITPRLPADPVTRAELDAGLAELSNRWTALGILKLASDPQAYTRDRKTYRHFNEMLPES